MDAGLGKQVQHYHAAPMIRTPIINRPASRDSRQCASDRAPLPLIFSWNCRHAGTSSPEEAAGVLHAA